MKVIFWFCLLSIIYAYIGYPILVYLLGRIMRKKTTVNKKDITPMVTIIIPAYNEEGVIREAINNKLSLDYPSDRLEILIVSDASTDKTEEIVKSFSKDRVGLIVAKERKGKLAAINIAASKAKGDILVFTDANTFFKEDNIKKLVRNFNDSKVVCVNGKKKMFEASTSIGKGEGLYWKYEGFIRKAESNAGSMIITDGGNLAIRKKVYHFPRQKAMGTDYPISWGLLSGGYRLIYEDEAVAFEKPSLTMKDEFLRKGRVACFGWRATREIAIKNILNPFKKNGLHLLASWKIISHKILRWLVPYFLFGVFISNMSLIHISIYRRLFFIQMIFYLFGIIGLILQGFKIKVKLFYIFYYLFFANLALFMGSLKFIFGKRSNIWQPPQR